MMAKKYWEDYIIGERIETNGRTLTDADIRLFIGATDATHPAHVDAKYCERHPFKRIVIPGALILGVVDGFVVKEIVSNKILAAHYGYDKIRFLSPVYPGDTIWVEAEVIDKKVRNQEFGIVTFKYTVKNHNDEIIAVIHDLQMLERKTIQN